MRINVTAAEFFRIVQEQGGTLTETQKRIVEGKPIIPPGRTGSAARAPEARAKKPMLFGGVIRIDDLDNPSFGRGGDV
jgi:hypothetical protein